MMKGNKEMKTTLRMQIKTGAFALALTMVANLTLGQYPPASHLATRWWQWALETSAFENPLTDTTGQFAAVNQSGRVWFLAAGVYFPAVDSGYYVLLPPLSAGQHTIHWAGSITFFPLSLDVTYNITVQ
jgi:hypothetical protein